MVTGRAVERGAVAVDQGLDRLDRLQGAGGQADQQHQQRRRTAKRSGLAELGPALADGEAPQPDEAEHAAAGSAKDTRDPRAPRRATAWGRR